MLEELAPPNVALFGAPKTDPFVAGAPKLDGVDPKTPELGCPKALAVVVVVDPKPVDVVVGAANMFDVWLVVFGAPKIPPEVVVGAPKTPGFCVEAPKEGAEFGAPNTLLAVVDVLKANDFVVCGALPKANVFEFVVTEAFGVGFGASPKVNAEF